MVLDMDREPLLTGIEARPLRDCPAQQHAIELEPEIVMQTARGMLLHDKGERHCGRVLAHPACRLRRFAKVAFAVVLFERHRGDRAVLGQKGRSRPFACNPPANIGTPQSPAKTARRQLGTARHREANHHRNREAKDDRGQQSFDHRFLLFAERDAKRRGSAACG
jgi:hypothetical protein